jgi:hypothetical protein
MSEEDWRSFFDLMARQQETNPVMSSQGRPSTISPAENYAESLGSPDAMQADLTELLMRLFNDAAAQQSESCETPSGQDLFGISPMFGSESTICESDISTRTPDLIEFCNRTGAAEPPRLNLLEALRIRSPEDEQRVITVRKVHKLGFKSQMFLKQYFSRYGHVEDVVLLPMRSRPKPMADGSIRGNRPSSMGFVVMSSPQAARAALLSPVQEIRGWPIEVRPFIRPSDRD